MSKGERIFAVIAFVWLALWMMGAVMFHVAAKHTDADRERIAGPPVVERGGALRAEGIVVGETTTALFSGKPCVAALTDVTASSWYRDAQGKTAWTRVSVAERRTGPAHVAIAVGDDRLALPLGLWTPDPSKSADVQAQLDQVPPQLGLSRREIADGRARADAAGSFSGFDIGEWLLVDRAPVFIVGQLDEAGVISADPGLGRVELFRGTQAERVAQLQGSAGGLRIAGWIFVALAVLPWLGWGVVILRRRAA